MCCSGSASESSPNGMTYPPVLPLARLMSGSAPWQQSSAKLVSRKCLGGWHVLLCLCSLANPVRTLALAEPVQTLPNTGGTYANTDRTYASTDRTYATEPVQTLAGRVAPATLRTSWSLCLCGSGRGARPARQSGMACWRLRVWGILPRTKDQGRTEDPGPKTRGPLLLPHQLHRCLLHEGGDR